MFSRTAGVIPAWESDFKRSRRRPAEPPRSRSPGGTGQAAQPPSAVGGAVLVIDKETGEITTWADLGPKIIDQYRRHKRGEPTI
jgi:hypothetical protein